MPTNTLTDAKCKGAKPAARPYKLFDGGGLHLYVTTAGGRAWRLAYRLDGKPQTATFGQYPEVSLAEARAKRDDVRRKLREGEPVKAPKPKDVPTLQQAVDLYWSGRKDVGEDYRADVTRGLARHVYPLLGGRPVDQVATEDLLQVLNKMNADGRYVYVRKVRMWLEQVFDWAVAQLHCKVNPAALINPRKAFGKAKVQSFAALAVKDVPAFMARLSLEGLIQSAQACRLLALTWVRTKELRMMEWTEIDGDLWTIPAGKMKRAKDLLVPLSRQALAVIANMCARGRGSKYVFPNDQRPNRPMSENAVLYVIGAIGYGGQMTGHGWRSVASTWANELGYNPDAIERQLAHVPGDKVRGIYNRALYLKERRLLLQDWADWLMPDAAAAAHLPSPAWNGASSEFSG
jgi:integrase